MGLLRVALNPVRYSYANYLHRNIPASKTFVPFSRYFVKFVVIHIKFWSDMLQVNVWWLIFFFLIAAPIGFRFYTTSKKPPTKNGMVNNRKEPIGKKKLKICPPLTIYPQQSIKKIESDNNEIVTKKNENELMKKTREPAKEVFRR